MDAVARAAVLPHHTFLEALLLVWPMGLEAKLGRPDI